MKYIAYGSNMVREQMAVRCPDARMIGIGHICGFSLEFYLHATVEETGDPGDTVPVAVWEIDAKDETNLDIYEGYPDYYGKDYRQVRMEDGSVEEGMIYLMRRIRHLPPQEQYYQGIADAYRNLGLDSRIETVLEPALERALKRH